VGEAQDAISSPEFTDWMAYAELEPFGPAQVAWQLAVIAATVANANRDPKKRSQPFQPSDFLPEEPMTDRERADRLRSKFDAAMMAVGGRPRRPGESKGRRKPSGASGGIGSPGPPRGGRKLAEQRPRGRS
jgi:hypothetical protein